MTRITYKAAGVDIDAGQELVKKIKTRVQQTYGERVLSGVGGFASLYDIGGGRYLAAGADGVGTKLLVAQRLGIHHTIGIDLVAMCINDVLCTGARGLFFMDYLAMGKLELDVCESVIAGITEGCMAAKVALIGGETAEMPGMYPPGRYDLAGFAIGEVHQEDLLDGSQLENGDAIVGLASSGIHSNGLSLARRLGREHNDEEYWKELLVPTRIYTPYIEAIREQKIPIHGLAHITGGGLDNIKRISEKATVVIDTLPARSEIAPIFSQLIERSGLPKEELYRTFNMGIGMAVVTPEPQRVLGLMKTLDIRAWIIGRMERV